MSYITIGYLLQIVVISLAIIVMKYCNINQIKKDIIRLILALCQYLVTMLITRLVKLKIFIHKKQANKMSKLKRKKIKKTQTPKHYTEQIQQHDLRFNESEIFMSNEMEQKCVICKSAINVKDNHQNLKNSLCQKCYNNKKYNVFQKQCFKCETPLVKNKVLGIGIRLCKECRPATNKRGLFFQKIETDRLQYFCGCNSCTTVGIQKCKMHPCYQCTIPTRKNSV